MISAIKQKESKVQRNSIKEDDHTEDSLVLFYKRGEKGIVDEYPTLSKFEENSTYFILPKSKKEQDVDKFNFHNLSLHYKEGETNIQIENASVKYEGYIFKIPSDMKTKINEYKDKIEIEYLNVPQNKDK